MPTRFFFFSFLTQRYFWKGKIHRNFFFGYPPKCLQMNFPFLSSNQTNLQFQREVPDRVNTFFSYTVLFPSGPHIQICQQIYWNLICCFQLNNETGNTHNTKQARYLCSRNKLFVFLIYVRVQLLEEALPSEKNAVCPKTYVKLKEHQ